jgi:histidinol-phosphate aminotransferase
MPTRTSREQAPRFLVRPIIQKLQGYVPGEQPRISGLVKLNTNENPYGPSPTVIRALQAAINGRLRLYPNPTAERLRQKLAVYHHCAPENIIVGNGSDELLALATRAFVEPLSGLTHYALQAGAHAGLGQSIKRKKSAVVGLDGALAPSRYAVQYLNPGYSLYPVLAAIHGAWPKSIPLRKDFGLPSRETLRKSGWDLDAALTYITTPNAPSGRGYTSLELEQICARHRGVIVLDEAYVDFGPEHALGLALKYPNVIVSRTFSKAYSLCALRVGYFVGHPDLIDALQKIRDSYNVNGLGQVAAEAALDSLPYYRKNFQRIMASREHLSQQLRRSDFEVLPSQTNFIFVRPPRFPAAVWLEKLREQKVLVRWFSSKELHQFLRISIGSETEVETLIKAVRAILRNTEA